MLVEIFPRLRCLPDVLFVQVPSGIPPNTAIGVLNVFFRSVPVIRGTGAVYNDRNLRVSLTLEGGAALANNEHKQRRSVATCGGIRLWANRTSGGTLLGWKPNFCSSIHFMSPLFCALCTSTATKISFSWVLRPSTFTRSSAMLLRRIS